MSGTEPTSGRQTVKFFSDPAALPQVIRDVNAFLNAMPRDIGIQRVFLDEGEVTLEWKYERKHAEVTFEGDGTIVYAMKDDGHYIPGAFVELPASVFPSDLAKYLR